jgi:hypothetical protein
VILVFQTDERAVNGKIEARFLSWPITSCLLVIQEQSGNHVRQADFLLPIGFSREVRSEPFGQIITKI